MAVTRVSTAPSLSDGLVSLLEALWDMPVTVTGLRRLTGGASRQIWSFDAVRPSGAVSELVLRRDPPGHGDAPRMRGELACLRAAHSAGVPVPAVLAAGDDSPGINAPFLLMTRVTGETIPRKLHREQRFDAIRPHLTQELGRTMARIHRAPLDGLGMLSPEDPLVSITAIYRELDDPRPAAEIGLRWLAENRPPARPTALVHADFRLGNVLISPRGIEAVLDWELAHLGDPIEDLGWLCVRAWRFDSPAPVAGLGERADLLDGYERESGFRPTEEELHWWEVFGTLRWLVLSRFQAERHIGGTERSTEFAAIGRRVCESEFDLLHVLGLVEFPRGTEQGADTAVPGLHGDPDAADLLQVAADAISTELLPAIDDEAARYQARICANLLRITRRELLLGPRQQRAHAARLNAIGCTDEASLASKIRAGEIDPLSPSVLDAITAAVGARLQVSNPRHLAH